MPVVVKKPDFDYRKHAEELLREAESAFAEENYISAYGLAGHALKVYLSNRYYNGTEVTNEEILSKIVLNNEKIWAIKTILDDCELVEFAKESPDRERFNEIISYIRKVVAE